MENNEKKFLNYSHYVITITGIIYYLVKNFFQVQGEWGVESHPFEVHLQHFHILSVPILLVAISMIFKDHVLKKIISKSRLMKKSGISLLVLAIIMIFSGYGIQVAMSTIVRNAMINIHLVSSLAWIVVFLYHQIKSKNYIKTK